MAPEKLALQFGAGNIGRGFIGAVLSQAGFHVVFADVQEEIVNTLNREHKYDIHVLDEETRKETVENVSAIFSTDAAAFEKIAKEPLSIITTAVGPNILPRLAKPIATIIRTRKAGNLGPFNVVACENTQRATDILRDAVLKELNDEERAYAQENVGFAVCSVDRIVPPYDTDEILDVGVEPFYEWIVDGKSLKKTDPDVEIKGMLTTDNLDAYIQRKLFILNCGHAITAFLGALPATASSVAAQISTSLSLDRTSKPSPNGSGASTPNVPAQPYIIDAITTPGIYTIVTRALLESAAALEKKHGFPKEQQEEYVEKILRRFGNPNMMDEVARVGREPLRKLKKHDRLLGPIEMCKEYGLERDALLVGVAAALLFNPKKRTKSRTGSRGSRASRSSLTLFKRPFINGLSMTSSSLANQSAVADDEWEDEEADEQAKDLTIMIAEKGVVAVLKDLTGWNEDDEDMKKVLKAYEALAKDGVDAVSKEFKSKLEKS